MQPILIVDYGSGNLRSVAKAVERAGVPVEITTNPASLERAAGVVLPGVGAFRSAMENLERGGWIEPLRDYLAADRPFLGICLGLQLLFEESEEFGLTRGFGVVSGRVRLFPAPSQVACGGERAKVPHMGWNQLQPVRASALLDGLEAGTWAYFVHSFYVDCADPDVIAATTRHGDVTFTSAIARGNLMACQFHPEKSQAVGLKILQNFVERVR